MNYTLALKIIKRYRLTTGKFIAIRANGNFTIIIATRER